MSATKHLRLNSKESQRTLVVGECQKAKFESYVKQSEKQKEKKTTRFPIIIPIVIALALLVYAILRRHKII